jgi:CBS domain-containing protein
MPAEVPNRSIIPTLRLRRIVDESGATLDHPIGPHTAGTETVAAIMSRTTLCMKPDVGVSTAASILLEQRMSGAPVVDADDRPIGVISKTDLLRHLHERGDAVDISASPEKIDAALGTGFHDTGVDESTVADVMMPVVFAIAEDTTIGVASALMAGEGVHRLPVLGEDGTVVGILSTLDIVRWVARQSGYQV